jgi:hypothetical protein
MSAMSHFLCNGGITAYSGPAEPAQVVISFIAVSDGTPDLPFPETALVMKFKRVSSAHCVWISPQNKS